MTFAVKELRAEFTKGSGGIDYNIQKTYIRLAAAASDVVLDFGDSAGALRSDLANTAIGVKVNEYLTDLTAVAQKGPKYNSDQLVDRVQVSTVSGAGEYEAAINNKQLKITVNAADGETTWELEFEHLLQYKKVGLSQHYRVD